VPLFMDAIAPALLVAQAVGRLGNYFNQELFGKPTSLPWGLQIDPQFRPQGYEGFTTFQPTFLYEMLFDLALAGLLVWLGRRGTIRPPGLFALYVTGYSAFRIFEESLRIDSSVHFLGLRLNFFIATLLTVAGATWFVLSQRRRPDQAPPAGPAEPERDSPELASPELASPELASSDHSGSDKAVSGDQGGQAGLGQTV
jgi:prolipoprotein diacylglyceryl transferase